MMGFSWKRTFTGFLLWRLLFALVSVSWHVPDETWQSVEVAHKLAFGKGHSTWEWLEDASIRSYCHPLIFVPPQLLGHALGFGNAERARWLVVVLPRMAQAVLSAAGDLCAVAFCRREFGGSRVASTFVVGYGTAVFVNYCYSRTLVNSFEAALTSAALWLYPNTPSARRRGGGAAYVAIISLSFAVRPTTALLWLPLVATHVLRLFTEGRLQQLFTRLAPAALLSLGTVTVIDSRLYGRLVLAPLNFFLLNVVRDIGSFYGTNPWHWYLTSGLPSLLSVYAYPAFLMGLWESWPDRQTGPFARAAVLALAAYSLVAHKEMRFLLPLAPLCWCFASRWISGMVSDRALLLANLAVSVPATLYLSLVHQTGNMAAVEQLALTAPANSTVLFLTPCHSSPGWSHLHGREDDLRVQFLTCEPYLENDGGEWAYVDEAEKFYQDPTKFLTEKYRATTSLLPDRLVLFDSMVGHIGEFLSSGSYAECSDFFHSHLAGGNERVSGRIKIFCRV